MEDIIYSSRKTHIVNLIILYIILWALCLAPLFFIPLNYWWLYLPGTLLLLVLAFVFIRKNSIVIEFREQYFSVRWLFRRKDASVIRHHYSEVDAVWYDQNSRRSKGALKIRLSESGRSYLISMAGENEEKVRQVLSLFESKRIKTHIR